MNYTEIALNKGFKNHNFLQKNYKDESALLATGSPV